MVLPPWPLFSRKGGEWQATNRVERKLGPATRWPSEARASSSGRCRLRSRRVNRRYGSRGDTGSARRHDCRHLPSRLPEPLWVRRWRQQFQHSCRVSPVDLAKLPPKQLPGKRCRPRRSVGSGAASGRSIAVSAPSTSSLRPPSSSRITAFETTAEERPGCRRTSGGRSLATLPRISICQSGYRTSYSGSFRRVRHRARPMGSFRASPLHHCRSRSGFDSRVVDRIRHTSVCLQRLLDATTIAKGAGVFGWRHSEVTLEKSLEMMRRISDCACHLRKARRPPPIARSA